LLDPRGRPVPLTTGEFRLFQLLADQGCEVPSRETLALRLGGEGYDRAIDITISRLRRKLADHGGEGLIRTVRDEG